jgi:hypothetical protein
MPFTALGLSRPGKNTARTATQLDRNSKHDAEARAARAPPTRVTGLAGTRMRRRRRARARAGPPTCDDPRDRWIGFGRRPRRAAPRDVRPGEYANR